MRTIVDRAADFVLAVERVFGVRPRLLDGSRAVMIGDVKLSLEARETELCVIRMHGAAIVGAYLEEAFTAALQLEENAQLQITASALDTVDQLTPAEVEQSNRESWTPNSIAKRWEYYREKETRKVGNPSN